MQAGDVLMVCLGNICRSPLAEGIFSHYSQDYTIRVDSAGTANYHTGAAPDPRSIAIASENKIDISAQKARQFTVKDFQRYDYIYVMDKQNLSNVLRLATTAQERAKVRLLLDPHEVEDPYYGGDEGFAIVFDKIAKACKEIIAQWKH